MHQYQRKTYHEEKTLVVIASIEDYRYAYNLSPMFLRSSVSDLTEKHQLLLSGIDTYLEHKARKEKLGKEDIIFTRGEICQEIGWQLHQIRSFLPLLVDLEYLIQIGKSLKGATHKYRRNYNMSDPSNPMSWLISPEDLENKLKWKQ